MKLTNQNILFVLTNQIWSELHHIYITTCVHSPALR